MLDGVHASRGNDHRLKDLLVLEWCLPIATKFIAIFAEERLGNGDEMSKGNQR